MIVGHAMDAQSPLILNKASMDNDYWFDGTAEVNRYSLKQNRYQEIHEGSAVVIYVTEDFLVNKQVKNERYAGGESVKVLKRIEQRKFPTGIYDYTIYSSAFITYEENPLTLKITGSTQEWCGTSFLQLNAKGKTYAVEQRSYFESEADRSFVIDRAVTEEWIFTTLRLNPEKLTIGNFNIIPSNLVLQMKHHEIAPYSAVGKFEKYSGKEFSGKDVGVYQFDIPAISRKVRIYFENKSPYVILGWNDAYPSAFDKEIRTTTARLIKSEKSDYWNKNHSKFQPNN